MTFAVLIYPILGLICFGLSGVCTGVMDNITFHYGSTKYLPLKDDKLLGKGRSYWDEDLAWRNK